MGLNAKDVPMGGGNRVEQPLLEAGGYPARVVQIIDLGLQEQAPWQGKPKPPVNEIQITYELLDEFCIDEEGNVLEDKPRWISETVPLRNLKQDKAKSTQRYYAIDPEEGCGGDFSQLVEYPVTVNLVQNPGKGKNKGRTFINVESLSTMRAKEREKAPELQNPTRVFLLEEPDKEVFESLPEFIREKIMENLEYNGSKLQELLGEEPTEDEQTEDQTADEPEGEEGEEKPW